MKINNKADALRLACAGIFGYFALRSVGFIPGWISSIANGSVLTILSFITLARNILVCLACIEREKRWGALGFGMEFVVRALITVWYSRTFHFAPLLSYLAYTALYLVAMLTCATKDPTAKKCSKILAGLYVFAVIMPCMNMRGDAIIEHVLRQLWMWALTAASYVLLAQVFPVMEDPKSNGVRDLPLLKNLPAVDFDEARSTALASIILSAPMSLIFCIPGKMVGVLAFMILSVGFTIAHIMDKPAREAQQEKFARIHAMAFAMNLENKFRSQRNGEVPYTPTLDTERLRSDLMDHYGTAMHSGFPMAGGDLVHVQGASEAELIREAQKNGFNINNYMN